MKIATVPPVPVEAEFRQEIERSLEGGETMAALVEKVVCTEVARRRDQSEFVRRGLGAIALSEAAGDWIPADVVLARLETKLAAAQERQARQPTWRSESSSAVGRGGHRAPVRLSL